MNKHQPADLKMMQSLPLDYKIMLTKERIRAWYETWKRYEIYDKETGKTRFVTAAIDGWIEEPPMNPSEYVESVFDGQVYVSFSGGKDSTVVSDLVRKALGRPDIIHIFGNTTLEFPETDRYVQRFKAANRKTPMLRAENKEQDFYNLCETFGPPSRS